MDRQGERIFVGVGGNLGDRDKTFRGVIRALESDSELTLVAASPVFETEPVGPPGQGRHLNAALELRSSLLPLALLRRLQSIEIALGRDRSGNAVRWGPRAVDLDLLFWGRRRFWLPDLVVPHPHAHRRAFVMVPLAVLAPDFEHPSFDRPFGEIAASLPDEKDVHSYPEVEGWPQPPLLSESPPADPDRL